MEDLKWKTEFWPDPFLFDFNDFSSFTDCCGCIIGPFVTHYIMKSKSLNSNTSVGFKQFSVECHHLKLWNFILDHVVCLSNQRKPKCLILKSIILWENLVPTLLWFGCKVVSYLRSLDHFDYQKSLFELCLHYCVHGSSYFRLKERRNTGLNG